MSEPKFHQTYPLRQHTPLIHFQHDQAGATLRASEVKPRVDQFIWHDLKRVAPDLWEKYQPWIKPRYISKVTDKKPKPSIYRLHISGTPNAFYIPTAYIREGDKRQLEQQITSLYGDNLQGIQPRTLKGTPYFANADKISKPEMLPKVRLAVMYKDLVLELFSPEPKVFELVEAVLPYVFARTNFGTRGNKGFGSFTVAGTNDTHLRQAYPYSFRIDLPSGDPAARFERLFGQIDLFYKSLRSGINVPNGKGKEGSRFYFKSLLFKYFYEKGIQWDKKSIKEHYYPSQIERQLSGPEDRNAPDSPLTFQSTDAFLVRDLMGLASSQEWGKTYKKDRITKRNLETDQEGKERIQRFASPVRFKPVKADDRGFTIYVGAQPIPPSYLGAEFAIERNGQAHNALSLRTPSRFDFAEFFRFAFEEVELDTHVAEDYRKQREYDQLQKIYNQLRKSR